VHIEDHPYVIDSFGIYSQGTMYQVNRSGQVKTRFSLTYMTETELCSRSKRMYVYVCMYVVDS